MVVGFVEDIDFEDEFIIFVIVNYINEELNNKDYFRIFMKLFMVVDVELILSEEDEDEEYKWNEEEDRKEIEKKWKEEERSKEKYKEVREIVKLKFDMLVKLLMMEELVVDGFGFGIEVVDDWLNLFDLDFKVCFIVVWFKLL